MAQQDQFTEKTGPRKTPAVYPAQQTLRYKTFLKATIGEALQNAFALYADPTLSKSKIGVDYNFDRADYPAIVIKFYEQKIQNVGVGHSEWGPEEESILKAKGRAVKGSNRITNLLTTEPFFPGETWVESGGSFPVGAYVTNINTATELTVNVPAVETEEEEFTFRGHVVGTKYIEYHHSLYHGDVALEIYSLSAVDRDKMADAIVEIVQMGVVGNEGKSFQERIYYAIGKSPYSNMHFLAVNTDLLQGYGEREEMPPWGPEDTLLYRCEYRIPVMGEFYSVTPKSTPTGLELLERVDIYPWSEQDPATTPPEDFPGGVVPPKDYIDIERPKQKNPYRVKVLQASLDAGGEVAP